jgi:hypothetical protein
MVWPVENGSKVAKAWQPMSAATCRGPTVSCASLIAENTGRSGQPMQKPGGRAGSGAGRLFATSARRVRLPSSQACTEAVSKAGSTPFSQAARPAAITSTVYSPPMGSKSLPCSGVWMSRRRSRVAISCSMYSG